MKNIKTAEIQKEEDAAASLKAAIRYTFPEAKQQDE
jgi:hypothetical protein